MVSCGRVVCVALPFVLAVVSIVALLVAALAGVADKNMYMFEVNTTGLSISASDAASILTSRALLADRAPSGSLHSIGIKRPSSIKAISTSTNITAADLNIGTKYDVALWNYCVTEQNGTRVCSKPEFNWAAKTLNHSEDSVMTLISSTGVDLTIPKDVRDAISVFSTLARWTQIVFIVAFAALALEIVFGLFTSCSRGVSCLTFVIAIITVVAVVGAAGLATAMSIVVVAAIKASAEKYGVNASVDSGFLAAVWIAAAAAVAASFFWMFTVCCCSPDKRRSRSGPGPARHLDDKNVPAGSYQPLHDPHQGAGFYNNNNNNNNAAAAYAPQYGAPHFAQGGRSDLAYEPYSHARN